MAEPILRRGALILPTNRLSSNGNAGMVENAA